MKTHRIALGTALVAGALAVAGCGMMDSSSKPATATPAAAPAAPAAAKPMPMMAGNSMSASLNAASEVPPNASSASGSATVKLDGDTLSWNITYSGLSGPVTGAHFHGPAPAGANAGVVLPFAGSLASPITGSKQLTPAQIVDVKAGLWYINLHPAAHPGPGAAGAGTGPHAPE